MGDTQLIINGLTFTFDPGEILSVESTIDSKKEDVQISGTSAMSCLNYDYDGVKKTIVITGKLYDCATTRVAGYTILTKFAQKQWLESMINGDQYEITLVDDFESQSVLKKSGATLPYLGSFTTTKALSAQVKFKRESGKPNETAFTITLDVGQRG